jgi:hypothetical protein
VPIVADIADLAPAEFLMMLATTSKTGKLSAVCKGQKILLVLQEGAIVYAASPMVRERLGSLLVNRGLVTEEKLYEALERQRNDSTRPLLGSVLIQMGAVSADDMREVLKVQFERVIREMLSWESGVMIFDSLEIPDIGAIPVDPADVLVGLGADTESLLVESLSRLQGDSIATEQEAPPVAPVQQSAEQQPAAEKPTTPEVQNVVRSLLEEMDGLSLALTAEMTLSLLGAAGEIAERALLLSVSPLDLSGIGGFGSGRDGAQLNGRSLRIPRDRRSLFTQVIEDGATYRGPLEDRDGNQELIEELGGVPSGEVIAVPLVVRDQVLAVLYADGGPGGSEVGSAQHIEGTMEYLATTLEGKRESPSGPGWKFKVKRNAEQSESSAEPA